MGVPGSIDAAPVQQAAVTGAVRAIAAELLPSAAQLSRAMNEVLYATIPELADSDDEALREETRASIEANIDQVLRLLKLGAGPDTLVLPPDAAEYVRSLVQRGIALPALLRTYRVGHAWLWD